MIKKIWENSFFRFLLVGGFNTFLGYILTLIFHYIFNIQAQKAQILNFIICFPIAYTLQALFAFKTPWSIKKLTIYPLSNIPSLLIQLLVTTVTLYFGIEAFIAYLLSYLLAIPVMFFVVRFIIGGSNENNKNK